MKVGTALPSTTFNTVLDTIVKLTFAQKQPSCAQKASVHLLK